MERRKREKLEAAGWKVTTVADFLGLSPEESRVVEIRAALARAVREARTGLGLTQAEVATRIGSEQSRVAKLEAAQGVSLDALLGAYFHLGGTPVGLIDVFWTVTAPGSMQSSQHQGTSPELGGQLVRSEWDTTTVVAGCDVTPKDGDSFVSQPAASNPDLDSYSLAA